MTNDRTDDPLDGALSRLAPPTPRASHDHRVRRRCHDVLAGRRAHRERPAPPVRLPDVMLAAAVLSYVIAVVSEAARVLGHWAG